MRFKAMLAGGAVASLIYFTPATANAEVPAFSGTLSTGYGFALNDGQDDLYGFNGSAQAPFGDSQWGAEVLGGYHRPENGGADIWNVGGSLYTARDWGRLAANFTYHSVAGAEIKTTGAGGEWFAAPDLTLAARSGGVFWTGNDGGFVGVQASWYATPDFVVSGAVDYWSAGVNGTTETFKVEWLPWETLPVSLYTGFQHWNQPGVSDSTIFVGVRFHLSGSGAQTLVERQRKDMNGFITTSPLYDAQY